MDCWEQRVIEEAAKSYGTKTQTIQAVEEFSELLVVLSKIVNGRYSSKDHLIPLIDEVADCQIMLNSLKSIYEIEDQVSERVFFKLNRLRERVRERNGRHGDEKL